MLGYDSFETLRGVGLTGNLFVDPEDRRRLVARLTQDGELVEAEYELRRRDGSIITVSENARTIRDERGEVTGFEGTITDVTERKRAEIRLFEEKERARITSYNVCYTKLLRNILRLPLDTWSLPTFLVFLLSGYRDDILCRICRNHFFERNNFV